MVNPLLRVFEGDGRTLRSTFALETMETLRKPRKRAAALDRPAQTIFLT